MTEYRKYDKIQNKGFDPVLFQDGLVVQEKLDGSNASFTMNADGELEVFSRNNQLDGENTLNGFYQYAHDLVWYTKLHGEPLEEYIYYGEWLVKHKVPYKDENYKEFYLFDIFDKLGNKYLSYPQVKDFADKHDIRMVDTLLELPPTILEESDLEEVDNKIRKLVGESHLTPFGIKGEGIVVKPWTNRYSDAPTFKIVTDEFKEFSNRKLNNEKKVTGGIADYAITTPRMEKMIFRAIDDGRLQYDDLKLEEFSKVMKEVGQNFVEDIMTEEQDEILKLVRKQIQKKMPIVLREILSKDNPLGDDYNG